MGHSLAWVPYDEFRRVRDGIGDPYDRCRAFAALARINTLYMVMRAGSGHLGSSFSAADIVAWLYLEELRNPLAPGGDVYFSSKGHDAPGLYATLIGLGGLPEERLHRLRRLDGLPGHPDVGTPHIHANTGSLGMGISKAKGMVLGNRLTGVEQRVFVLTGDGELQEGQIWESLAGAAHHRMGELTVIVDHNKIQSDTWVSDVGDLGDLGAKFASFGWGVLRCDGNDPRALRAALHERAAGYPDRPVAIIADTVKGAGCAAFAATGMRAGEWRYRFHSGAPRPDEYRAAHDQLVQSADGVLAAHGLSPLRVREAQPPTTAPAVGDRLPAAYGRALAELAAADERVVALDADLVLDTGLVPFRTHFPDRFVECGIAEQDMVSMAGGLAARGLLPFVHSFSCFLHARPNEQIYNNATEGRRVVYVGSLAGLLPAGPGHSHQAVRDISALASVPGLVMLQPANAAQLEAAVRYCAEADTSVYLRIASTPCPPRIAKFSAGPLVTGRGRILLPGGPILAVGAGHDVLGRLLQAADLLRGDGIELTVVELPWLNRVDPDWLEELLHGATDLIVAEHHYTAGGQADLLARALAEMKTAPPVRLRGIGLSDIPRCGTDTEVLAAHELSAVRIATAVQRLADR